MESQLNTSKVFLVFASSVNVISLWVCAYLQISVVRKVRFGLMLRTESVTPAVSFLLAHGICYVSLAVALGVSLLLAFFRLKLSRWVLVGMLIASSVLMVLFTLVSLALASQYIPPSSPLSN